MHQSMVYPRWMEQALEPLFCCYRSWMVVIASSSNVVIDCGLFLFILLEDPFFKTWEICCLCICLMNFATFAN